MTTLTVWPSTTTLASIDPKCLAAVALVRLASKDFTSVQETWTMLQTPLPELRTPTSYGDRLTSLTAILKYLRMHYSLDSHLTPDQLADNDALISFILTDLLVLVDFAMLEDIEVWNRQVKPCYARGCIFPTNLWVPDSMRSDRLAVCAKKGYKPLTTSRLGDNEPASRLVDPKLGRLDDARRLTSTLKVSLRKTFHLERFETQARAVLDVLRSRLQGTAFFLGTSRPSSSDAIAAALVAVVTIGLEETSPLKLLFESEYALLGMHTLSLKHLWEPTP